MNPDSRHPKTMASRRAGVAAWVMAVAGAAVLAAAAPAGALTLDDVRGHVAFGYSKLFITNSPSGSLSVEAGLTLPMHGYGIGTDIGVHLLGTRTVVRDGEIASVDYSLFEAGVLLRYTPRAFPIANLSFGPEVMSARAVLSTSGGGAAFQDLAVEQVVPGYALDVTFLQRRPAPVRVGFEFGLRQAFVTGGDTWKIADVRLAIHY